MGSNRYNLTLRFLLEMAALLGMGYWGWTQATGWQRYTFGVGIPLVAAGLWGTFAVPDDPSRSGKAPVPVPGFLRLALELAIFGFGAWALHDAGATSLGWTLAAVTVVHYALSYDRVAWLIKQ